jgi:sugar phosphate isomerase/epimerase
MPLMTSRRALVAGAASALVAGYAPPPALPRRIGVQLYTLRSLAAQDLPGVLRTVASIGYDEVEFAGYFDTAPRDVKRALNDAGLAAPASHVGALAARDEPGRLIDAAAEVGHGTLVVAWLPPEERQSMDQWRAWADVLNRFAVQCRDAGLKFAYHNHDFEFTPIEGLKPFDTLLQRCERGLVDFELDLYWATLAGEDPSALLAANAARFPLCHVKDMDRNRRMADVGAGEIDFARIFARHRFAHYFVEHDQPADPIASIRASYATMRRILPA